MKHLAKRALTFTLVLAMLLSTVAVTALADGDTPDVSPNPAADNAHVLEASALAAFDAGAKADGDSETVGDYFTVLYSAKSKVDNSTKDWDDGYHSEQRINFGGKAGTDKNSVKFTTSGPATVKIWWAKNGDDDRQMAILDASGEIVAATTGAHEKNAPYLDTLELAEAGTYFLGGDTNGNYIFKVEVEETPVATEKVSTLESSALAAFDAGAKADGDSETVGDYFTVLYSAKSKVDGSTKEWDDGYHSEQRINFGGKAGTDKNSVKFTTSGPATVKIWWAKNGDDDRQMAILDASGEIVAATTGAHEKNAPYLDTLELAEAGTYFLGGDTNGNYIFKVEVTEGGSTEKPPRADWAGVAAPAIAVVEPAVDENGEETGEIAVTVTGEVGYDGADKITVSMLDEDGWEIEAHDSLAEQSEHTLTFSPDKTGKYAFTVKAARESESAIHRSAGTVDYDYTYPLGVPVMKYAVNDGKGGITVEWNAVKEATGYVVTVGDKTAATEGVNATKATVEGLTVGNEVSVTVKALRGDEEGEDSDAIKVTVSDTAETAWVFSAFGQSTDKENNGAEANEDGSVRVYSVNGKGKVQPSAQDGLAFYYTAIDPNTTNFKLSATAHVNTWHFSNGQDGFGLIVMDKVGVNGDTSPVWCNSLMAGVTGFSSTYNGEKVDMRLGVGSLERSGVLENTTAAAPPDGYTGTWTTLDITGFGSNIRNLVGNCDNQDALDKRGESLGLVDFPLTIEKDDEGYHVSYLDHTGVLRTNDYPNTQMTVDPYVYVGMFAARNCDITFTDIEFTTSASSGSGPAAPEDKTVDASYAFKNPAVSNQEAFNLDFRSNADGKAVITDKDGKELYKGVVKAGEKVTVSVTLAAGANEFTAVMTPDEGFVTADGMKLTSYDTQTLTTTVNLSVDTRTTIYVSPYGKADAKGTRDDPTTLAEAVKCPAPGAVIILMEGTYRYAEGVTIARGINGTEAKPITLKADLEAGSRPVLNWGEQGGGLTLSADYWHLYGFDTTFAKGKGIHIGGNHNVIERVIAHDNLESGISISRTWSSDDFADWPSYNTVKNCSAWLNADSGYEDADGFEAKLTNGDGNVFDGCIAAYNADDGWDLFARGATNGAVTIKNSVAFKNGYDIVDGKEVNAGNGNGFKLGGNSYAVKHRIENSIAFANKGNGFTCNSNPDLIVENCTGFANEKGNLALYTEAENSAYAVDGFISYMGGNDSIEPRGTQDKAAYLKDTNYYVGHTSGIDVADEWFVNLDANAAILSGISRNADGTISMNGFLQLTGKSPDDAGARLPGDQEGHNYRDTIPGAWYYDAVNEMFEKNIMVGASASEFAPDGTASRGMVATVIHRVAGTPASKADSASSDVKKDDWFAKAVAWAEENGVIAGADGKFNPDGTITRQDTVKALYLYAGLAGLDVDVAGSQALEKFTDAAALGADNVDAMTWAVSRGVICGTSADTLSPDGTLTRAELAVILQRFLKIEK